MKEEKRMRKALKMVLGIAIILLIAAYGVPTTEALAAGPCECGCGQCSADTLSDNFASRIVDSIDGYIICESQLYTPVLLNMGDVEDFVFAEDLKPLDAPLYWSDKSLRLACAKHDLVEHDGVIYRGLADSACEPADAHIYSSMATNIAPLDPEVGLVADSTVFFSLDSLPSWVFDSRDIYMDVYYPTEVKADTEGQFFMIVRNDTGDKFAYGQCSFVAKDDLRFIQGGRTENSVTVNVQTYSQLKRISVEFCTSATDKMVKSREGHEKRSGEISVSVEFHPLNDMSQFFVAGVEEL